MIEFRLLLTPGHLIDLAIASVRRIVSKCPVFKKIKIISGKLWDQRLNCKIHNCKATFLLIPTQSFR